MPYLVLGVALVVVGALTAVLLVTRSGGRIAVLALVRDVGVGQPVTAADVRVEQVAAGTSVPVVLASASATVVGRPAAVPLRAGRLLAPDDVGPQAWPPAGKLLLAVPVGPGAYPPELAAGMHVLVGTGTDSTAAGAPAASASPGAASAGSSDGLAGAPEGVVVGVQDNPAGSGGKIISLLLPRQGAGQVTSVPPSQLRLVVLPTTAAPTPSVGGGG
jgi:hypothetical protein